MDTAKASLATETIRYDVGESSLGLVLVAQSDAGVCAVLFGDDRDELRRDLQQRFLHAALIEGDKALHLQLADVIAHIESPTCALDVTLDMRGTAFQRAVWETLREIPGGTTASYGDIANRIGSPKSVRAVAQACGANALAVVVPCHRVVKSDGGLSGYRWGTERKHALLAREAQATHTTQCAPVV